MKVFTLLLVLLLLWCWIDWRKRYADLTSQLQDAVRWIAALERRIDVLAQADHYDRVGLETLATSAPETAGTTTVQREKDTFQIAVGRGLVSDLARELKQLAVRAKANASTTTDGIAIDPEVQATAPRRAPLGFALQ